MNIVTVPPDYLDKKGKKGTKWNNRDLPIKYIVLHSTDGTNSLPWLSTWNRVVQNSPQNDVSIHYLVARNGTIYQIVPDEYRAWHAGYCKMPDGEIDGNSCSIGIELEHKNEPDYPEAQLKAAAELVATLFKKHSISALVYHKDVAIDKNTGKTGRKVDPVNFPEDRFWTYVFSYGANYPVEYSSQSPLLNKPDVKNLDMLKKYIWKNVSSQKNPGEYTEFDVGSIVDSYKKYGEQVGVDWVLALAQSMHETGWLSSWWSQRPRRNPAGIGVTGATRTTRPPDMTGWAKHDYYWSKGYSFESWDKAAQQHLGRLLCYAMYDSEMTDAQRNLATACVNKDSMKQVRATSKRLDGLNGRWAVPGTHYAQSIARIATNMLNAATPVNK